MAPKSKKALPLPPPSPEPEEEEEEETSEEEESEEGEEEESDVEENGNTNPIQPSQLNKKVAVQKQSGPAPAPAPTPTPTPIPIPAEEEEEEESEEEEEGSGSEEEEEDAEEEEEEEEEEPGSPPSPNVSDFTVMPISQAKRSLDNQKYDENESRNGKKAKTTEGGEKAKRPLDTQKDDENESRNSKKVKTNDGGEKKENGSVVSKSGGVGKVWSEEDQIAVLQGMIDYQKKHGTDPNSDKDAFYSFIKRKLQAGISKNQLYDKVRRLKKKYLTYVEKGGEDLDSKSFESKVFDLSKKIWGNADEKNDGKSVSINGDVKESKKNDSFMDDWKKDDSVMDDMKKEVAVMDDLTGDGRDFQTKYPYLSESLDVDSSSFLPVHLITAVKKNLYLIDGVKARELDEKWKNIRQQEAEVYLKKINLVKEHTELLLNAGKEESVVTTN